MAANPLHFVFTGGGTGGHLFPGLAVAAELVRRAPGVRITFAGSGKEFERRHVAGAGFDYLALSSRPLPRRLREVVGFVTQNLAGYVTACRLLRAQRVNAVVGLGGYASVPMGCAAAGRGVPLVLLEQNAVPGRATRWLTRRAQLICLALPQASAGLRSGCPVLLTGNPIRGGFRASSPLSRQLLILGGSSGAQTLNESVPRALGRIARELAGWNIVHQSGESGFAATDALYRKLNLPAKVIPFIADMPEVLATSGLAICRAGGTTLAELAAAGVPAILVPYPHAADDHQRANADVYARAGAAVVMDQRDPSDPLDEHLAAALAPLPGDPHRRREMSRAARSIARPNAAAEVAELVLESTVARLHQSPVRGPDRETPPRCHNNEAAAGRCGPFRGS